MGSHEAISALGEQAVLVAELAADWETGFFPSDLSNNTKLPAIDVDNALVALFRNGHVEKIGANLYRLCQ